MRSVTKLIEQIRRQTENEEVSDFTGIDDKEFIQYINDAQYNLQAAIVHQHPRVFVKEVEIDAVTDQEKYTLPTDTFLKNKVHNVEYSPTGNEDDYYALEEDTIKRRNPGVSGSPVKYIRLSGQLLLTPQPQSAGKIRINYVHRLKELRKASAKVTADTTVVTTGNTTWTIALDNDTFTTDVDLLDEDNFVCVVDKFGNNVVADIEIVSVTNDILTCKPKTLASDDVATIPAGSFLISGANTSTHSELDISVERYLIAYAAWKILKRDSSVDSAEAMQELGNMQAEIVKSYAMISDDVQYIPQLNSWDDWSV